LCFQDLIFEQFLVRPCLPGSAVNYCSAINICSLKKLNKMKTLFIMLVALFATTSAIMAQKAKQNAIDTSKRVVYSCPMHTDVVSNLPGKCSKCGMDLQVSKKEQMKMDEVKYSCPMHP
jgi:hypothetical protein